MIQLLYIIDASRYIDDKYAQLKMDLVLHMYDRWLEQGKRREKNTSYTHMN